MKKIKVAIADDHNLFRKGIMSILKATSRYEIVIEATSGKQLLTLLKQHPVEIILMDMKMENMNGIETSKLVLKEFPEIRIIILSMFDEEDFILSSLELGIHGYLHKDVELEELEQAIKKVLDEGLYLGNEVAQVMVKNLRRKSTKKKRLDHKNLITPITKRERDVLHLICEGFTSPEIAEKLFLSQRTVEGHRRSLLEKTRTNNSVSLAMYAIKKGLLD